MGTGLGTWEDREQIRELYARYSQTIDNARYDEWIECFTEDGVFDSSRFGRHAGHEALRRFTAIYKEALSGGRPVHMMTNVSFSVEGDTASGGCYLAYFHCKDGKGALLAVGYYTDRMRKVKGEWKFESRKMTPYGALPQQG